MPTTRFESHFGASIGNKLPESEGNTKRLFTFFFLKENPISLSVWGSVYYVVTYLPRQNKKEEKERGVGDWIKSERVPQACRVLRHPPETPPTSLESPAPEGVSPAHPDNSSLRGRRLTPSALVRATRLKSLSPSRPLVSPPTSIHHPIISAEGANTSAIHSPSRPPFTTCRAQLEPRRKTEQGGQGVGAEGGRSIR